MYLRDKCSKNSKMKNKKTILAVILFLASFFVYLITLSPSVYVGDSGELVSAAYNLGVAHPPGYPLYVLLGKLFTVIPLSNIAYRLNLFSAICAALTSMTLFLTLTALISKYSLKTKNMNFSENILVFSAFSSSFFLAFSPLFWSQAVFAEVFTLNTFLVILVLFVILKGNIPLAFFLHGISMGNHHTALLSLPVFLYTLWLFYRKDFNFSNICIWFIFFILGLSVYAVIPIRALSNCKISWGDAVTFPKFLRMILREDYGNTFTLKPFVDSFLPSSFIFSRTAAYLYSIYNQLLIFGAVFAIIGFLTDRYKISILLFISTGLSLPFLLNAYFSPGIKVLVERFFILSLIPLCIGIFFGFLWISNLIKAKANYLSAFIPVLFLSPLILFPSNFRKNDLSGNYITRNYAVNILSPLEKNSTVFIYEGDAVVNSMVYLTKVENIFPEMKLHESEIRVLDNPYGKDYIYLTKSQRKLKREQVENEFIENPKEPVYFATVGIKEGKNIFQYGLIYKAEKNIPGETGLSENMLWKKYDLRGFEEDGIHKDFRTRNLISNYHYRLALYYKKNGLTDKMQNEIELCSKTAFDMEWIQNNLGNFYSANNMPEKEQESYKNAAMINPTFAEGYYNIGVIYMAKKQYPEAIKYYEKALTTDHLYAKAAWNLASAYSMTGDSSKVVYYLSLYIKLAPNDTAGINEAKNIIQSIRSSNTHQ